MCDISAGDLARKRVMFILLWVLKVLVFERQSIGVPACLSPKCLV